MDDQTIIQEFLIESAEALGRLDQEMVQLERDPANQALIGSVFRTLHTIKGTCGFLGFNRLEALAHACEDLLSEVRAGRRHFDPALTTVVLEGVDSIKTILVCIEELGHEGEVLELQALERLRLALDNGPAAQAALEVSAHTPKPKPAPAPIPPSPILQEQPMPEAPIHTPPPGPPPEPAQNEPAKAPTASETTLRVDVAVLDRLMNLVGELVLARNQVLQWNTALEDPALNAIRQRLNLITTELQEGVMKTRMQPIGVVWNKMPRIVRDLAASLGKDIALEMEGTETELDRTIIEAIKDPLTHIVRNSCDHGLELRHLREAAGKPAEGRLRLRAGHESGQVHIRIEDDGAGIDSERVKSKAVERGLLTADQAARLSEADALALIFHAGLSTASAVTNLSGRGVGMDVVKTSIERIGGTVELRSHRGEGTTVHIRIPLTLAIIPGLVVWCGGQRYVIPQVSLEELLRLEGDAALTGIEYVHEIPVLRRQGRLLPIVDLTQVLRLSPQRPLEELSIVVVNAAGTRFGLVVDAISDTEEIVVKPLQQGLKALALYAGATIMGDGEIALILDVAGLAERCGMGERSRQLSRSASAARPNSTSLRKAFLLVRCGALERLALPLGRVARLEDIPRERVEHAAGQPVVQYRGDMLTLHALAGTLGECPAASDDLTPLHVVVVRNSDRLTGLVVDEILDTFEEEVSAPRPSERFGILGSAVVGGLVTDFLDLDSVAALPAPPEALDRLKLALEACEPEREEVPA